MLTYESDLTFRINPACAGSTSENWNAFNILWGHPRMRGEHA